MYLFVALFLVIFEINQVFLCEEDRWPTGNGENLSHRKFEKKSIQEIPHFSDPIPTLFFLLHLSKNAVSIILNSNAMYLIDFSE